MQHFIFKSSIILSVCLATLLSATPAAAGAANQIEGTWEILGNPEPTCGVGPFVNLTAIAQDGTLVNVDPVVGTGVGEVQRVSGKVYAADFFGFINDGQAILRYEVNGDLTLVTASLMTGTFTSTLYDPAGQPFCSYNGTLEANRLVPDEG